MTGQTINTKSSVEIENLVKRTLENVRLKLLDLSRRNTLLNFKETKRSIRIINELPEGIYRKLLIDNVSMEFLPYQIPDDDENYYPHPEALEWHKKEVFNKFSL